MPMISVSSRGTGENFWRRVTIGLVYFDMKRPCSSSPGALENALHALWGFWEWKEERLESSLTILIFCLKALTNAAAVSWVRDLVSA